MKRISFATFDIRGTLLTFNRTIGDTYADAANKFGFNVDSVSVDANFKKQFSEMNRLHPNFGVKTGLNWRNWWKAVVIKTFTSSVNENTHLHISSKSLEPVADYLIDRFAMKHEWKAVPGSVDLLNFLKRKHIHMGVISNSDPRLHQILKELDINKYFDFTITSYEAGYSKPDINIFKKAENKFNIDGNKFDSCSAVHVGDSFKYDYCGAKNAGWNAALINPTLGKVSDDSNVLVFENLDEFKRHFFKYLF